MWSEMLGIKLCLRIKIPALNYPKTHKYFRRMVIEAPQEVVGGCPLAIWPHTGGGAQPTRPVRRARAEKVWENVLSYWFLVPASALTIL